MSDFQRVGKSDFLIFLIFCVSDSLVSELSEFYEVMKKVIFKIVDMHCVACSITIDGDLEERVGVKESKTNYAKAQTEVEFDPEKVTEKEILQIIKKAGYTAEEIKS